MTYCEQASLKKRNETKMKVKTKRPRLNLCDDGYDSGERDDFESSDLEEDPGQFDTADNAESEDFSDLIELVEEDEVCRAILLDAKDEEHKLVNCSVDSHEVPNATEAPQTDESSNISTHDLDPLSRNDDDSWSQIIQDDNATESSSCCWEEVSTADSVVSLSSAMTRWTFQQALIHGKLQRTSVRESQPKKFPFRRSEHFSLNQRRKSEEKKATTIDKDDDVMKDVHFDRDCAKSLRGGKASRMFRGNTPGHVNKHKAYYRGRVSDRW